MNALIRRVNDRVTLKRLYIVDIWGDGRCSSSIAFNKAYESDARIREFCVLVWRAHFGSDPSMVWGRDGFMGGAEDRRHRSMTVTQVNRDYFTVDRGAWERYQQRGPLALLPAGKEAS